MNPYLGLLFDQMASWFAQIQVVLAGSEEEHAMDLFPESIHQLVWETICAELLDSPKYRPENFQKAPNRVVGILRASGPLFARAAAQGGVRPVKPRPINIDLLVEAEIDDEYRPWGVTWDTLNADQIIPARRRVGKRLFLPLAILVEFELLRPNRGHLFLTDKGRASMDRLLTASTSDTRAVAQPKVA
jgi:hypothetical protein